ncbi:MAG TPA: 3,4-dihydroxy-2-butanone-4-phosphate synthase [Saprospiraceae bacterium]|nr:3,4-dihydroxy-2-butanone-4-phosphate synthase [Saprospiraceae bacterium]
MISVHEPHAGVLDTVADAIGDIRLGKMVIVVDDEDRENEGDFICAAECVTPEVINFMATHGRGLICAPLNEKRADELNLPMMVDENTALHATAFTVSIDLIGHGCTTGISAYDRARGIKALTDSAIKASDFARPGHIFPLRARSGGVLRRSGHTEAGIDLARLAGFYPAGVLVEILNADGTMARLPQLLEIARLHNLKIISIRDLIAYRMERERIVEQLDSVTVDTPYGMFDVIPFRQITSQDIHLAFVKGTLSTSPTLVRMHSAAETGDVLGILFDDYGLQLANSMKMIAEQGNGVLVYLRHNEHPEAILKKLSIYKKIHDTSPTDNEQRNIGVGAQILNALGIEKIRLITNHPRPRVGLLGFGLEIVETVSCG